MLLLSSTTNLLSKRSWSKHFVAPECRTVGHVHSIASTCRLRGCLWHVIAAAGLVSSGNVAKHHEFLMTPIGRTLRRRTKAIMKHLKHFLVWFAAKLCRTCKTLLQSLWKLLPSTPLQNSQPQFSCGRQQVVPATAAQSGVPSQPEAIHR